MPRRAKTTMKRKRRKSKLIMDFMEFRRDTTRLRKDAQYLKKTERQRKKYSKHYNSNIIYSPDVASNSRLTNGFNSSIFFRQIHHMALEDVEYSIWTTALVLESPSFQ